MQLINIGSPVSAGSSPDLPNNFWMNNGAPSSGDFGANRTVISPFIPQLNVLANRLSLYNANRVTSGSFVGAIYSKDGSERLATFDHDYTFTYLEEVVLSSEVDIKGQELYWLLFNNKGASNSLGRVNASAGRTLGENKFILTPELPPFDDADTSRGNFYTSETITEAPATIDLSESAVSGYNASGNMPWMALSRKVV